MYHKNPTKAKTKRRYVMGIREVTKHLKLKKLKCVILAPNCEKIQAKGGLDDAINFIIQTSMEQNVPFLFALGRKSLGKAVNKLVPISVVGIFDYAGAEEYFHRLVDLANNAKLAYQEMIEEYEKEECESFIYKVDANEIQKSNNDTKDNNSIPHSNLIMKNTIIMIPSHLGHSRNSSNGSNISIDHSLYHHINYHHSHSRSAPGNYNFGSSIGSGGHSRSASGGGGNTLNIDLSTHGGLGSKQHWTHSRTPSNCSNISFISRLSEPISEASSCGTLLLSGINPASQNNIVPYYISSGSTNQLNANNLNSTISTLTAVQYYTEQVRQEMTDQIGQQEKTSDTNVIIKTLSKPEDTNSCTVANAISSSLINLHLGCIDEIDAGHEADTEDIELRELKVNKNSNQKI